MKSESQRGRVPKPVLIMGRVELTPTGQKQLQPLHRETTLLYQQKVAALVECARDYAHDPTNARFEQKLLDIALAFAENA